MIETNEPITDQEQARRWSQQVQRRILRLLFLHDEPLLRNRFSLFYTTSQLPPLPLLQQYDRYIKLRLLSNALFDDILPRIRRQLSMKTSHTRLSEEAPTRGDIDWQRTIEQSWDDTPGLPALRFETRLRQHTLETPENLLTIALLLAYRRFIQAVQQESLSDEDLNTQERQFLVSMDERAERELAAPYARQLMAQARQVNIAALVEQVASHLRPGPSPYRDLLHWWQRFSTFRVGHAGQERATTLVSARDDEKTDAWLYEIWIALEFLHLLAEEGSIEAQDTQVDTDHLQYCFRWQGQRYRFLYNRQLDTMTGFTSAWTHGPASRPDYTIEREHPLEITHDGTLIWREPSVVLDAKYYLGGRDPTSTHGPIKKLLGDMTLLNAQVGLLFFPLLPEPADEGPVTRTIAHTGHQYIGSQDRQRQIHLVHLQPDMEPSFLQQRLRALLNLVVTYLPERPAPTCQGVWLDRDSVNASQVLPAPRLLLCPKPHIGADVFDLVDADHDCLNNPRVCHVIGQSIVRPEVMRVVTQADLHQKSLEVRQRGDARLQQAEAQGKEDEAEQIRGQVFTSIGSAVEQLTALRGDTRAIEEHFSKWVFKGYWQEGRRQLASETRNMLLSGEYVWYEYEHASLDDWAAPAIQYCRALEFEVKRRLYQHAPQMFRVPRVGWTLGTLRYLYQNRDDIGGDTAHNWRIIHAILKQSGCSADDFTAILKRLTHEHIIDQRNHLAHGDPIQKAVAESLRSAIIGDISTPGLLTWFVRHLDPA